MAAARPSEAWSRRVERRGWPLLLPAACWSVSRAMLRPSGYCVVCSGLGWSVNAQRTNLDEKRIIFGDDGIHFDAPATNPYDLDSGGCPLACPGGRRPVPGLLESVNWSIDFDRSIVGPPSAAASLARASVVEAVVEKMNTLLTHSAPHTRSLTHTPPHTPSNSSRRRKG